MSSVSQVMHEQEARLILYTCRHYLTETAVLYGIKSGSDGKWTLAISRLLACFLYWSFFYWDSPLGLGVLGFFPTTSRLHGWSRKGRPQFSCLQREIATCSTQLNEPSYGRETPRSWQFGFGTNLQQPLAHRNLNHTTRNPAKLINKISCATAQALGS